MGAQGVSASAGGIAVAPFPETLSRLLVPNAVGIEHLGEHDSGREHVGAGVERLAASLLGDM